MRVCVTGLSCDRSSLIQPEAFLWAFWGFNLMEQMILFA